MKRWVGGIRFWSRMWCCWMRRGRIMSWRGTECSPEALPGSIKAFSATSPQTCRKSPTSNTSSTESTTLNFNFLPKTTTSFTSSSSLSNSKSKSVVTTTSLSTKSCSTSKTSPSTTAAPSYNNSNASKKSVTKPNGSRRLKLTWLSPKSSRTASTSLTP